MKDHELNILLVEDNNQYADEIVKFLERFFGLEVLVTCTLNGLNRLLSRSGRTFDVIISDEKLPDGDFTTWAKRNQKLLQRKAVIINTALFNERLDRRGNFPIVNKRDPDLLATTVKKEIAKLMKEVYGY